ncbi:MAG: bifunctional 2-polyprenyl-6-hydroxyphenol methylase/3-demethylubiquinol 3-O-methyltransferase UbiG [Hyphomicrobiales bacterium]|nr:bifunctional 2-polyprenyl-6-hydroxyphenol methylase/3-demethylubiquinol 3-O-methyltransferase UbiG [Hyphomicrobiales bacterium]MCP5370679.1 bifunctional 2-polyprenyl-6-hydroxyphenol methylase/3-demethylubiquinol 3-O-methyltransferase UbiG [Hyphomicrobiales bacterium]
MTTETTGAQSPRRGATAAPDEVARFTAMADGWWDPAGKFRPLHQLNPPRIAFIRDQVAAHLGRDPLAPRPLGGLSVLDIGCGGGLLCEPMARLGARVTGIDAGDRNIQVAAAHAAQQGLDIDYRHQLPEDLATMGDTHDVVLNMEVIEHVADVDAFMAASAALVRPGGVMVLSTLNRTLKALALAKVGAEYVLRWLPPGTHDWRKFVRPSEMAAALRPHGLEVRALRGLVYNPFEDSWSLSRDLDVNYLAFAVKR